ncbi:MAG: hypothetical protein Q4G24_14675 [Paracoccus sp. (in: a-proteobacteria)]|uniref:hypothetical protein n=1 Tax=Paracoccus sp. TaxID=267 RepID=UPI0026DEF963|nr:hypothetical protein [Paracoccus sp. (in: a-proteobacteria)]MDO5622701.1 hypothetical protein [Paracoccus sp. (in: a-proteobacteria)]
MTRIRTFLANTLLKMAAVAAIGMGIMAAMAALVIGMVVMLAARPALGAARQQPVEASASPIGEATPT